MSAPGEPAQGAAAPPPGQPSIRIGVSACLLGQQVRYDAGHKRESFVAEVLPRYFEMVPVCPEVAIGLGVPREPIRLEGSAEAPRAVGVLTRDLDVTDRLRDYGRATAARLADISGYILKSKSPSCGMAQVRLYGADGRMRKAGTGIFAAELMRALPLLPVVEESALVTPALRENFVERVCAYRRWQDLQRTGITPERLARFHADHELILLAHGRRHSARLQQLVAEIGRSPMETLAQDYAAAFMQVLARPATRRGHAAVLARLQYSLQPAPEASERAELEALIRGYRRGELPLSEPLSLLRRHFRHRPQPATAQRLYLQYRLDAAAPRQ